MKVLSIVTVCFNPGERLRRCIRSVVRQKVEQVEYLVIDGASTDQAVQIINEFRCHIDGFVSEPDRGIYDAMNKGIRMASGAYIAFLNADDFYLPGAVDSLLAGISAAEQPADVIYGHWVGRGPGGRVKPRLADHRLGFRHRLCHQAMAVSRRLLQRYGGFCVRFRLCADFDLLLKARADNLAYMRLPRALVCFDEGGASNSRVMTASMETIAIAFRRLGPLHAILFSVPIVAHFIRWRAGRLKLGRFAGPTRRDGASH